MPLGEEYAIVRRVKGEVDDVAITGDLFRLEQMDKAVWWAAIYRGDKRVALWFRYNRKRGIVVNVQEDDFGCTDDSGQPAVAHEAGRCPDGR
jgi:hypothetical protein